MVGAHARIGRFSGLTVALGLGAGIFAAGQGVAAATPVSQGADSSTSNSPSSTRQATASSTRPQRGAPRGAAPAFVATANGTPNRSRAASAAAAVQIPRPGRALRRLEIPQLAADPTPAKTVDAGTAPAVRRVAADVAVDLPQLPVREGWSFTVSPDSIAEKAANYVATGADPGESASFFFGDLAVTSLDTLAAPDITAEQSRLQLGNLAASGYFGGIWLRDNLREAPAVIAPAAPVTTDLTVSALGIRLFDALAVGLMGAATTRSDWIARTTAHASVPALLALYGYNRGYLEVLLENPPAGIAPPQGTLNCDGFLGCKSEAFPLEIAGRHDGALDRLADPPNLGWQEMRLWTSVLEGATGAGRGVWESIAQAGAFSPTSYQALVELSSAYLMVSKAAVLSSMRGYADGDAEIARSSLRLQAGLWIWSGAYFAGLASTAPAGTVPAIVVG